MTIAKNQTIIFHSLYDGGSPMMANVSSEVFLEEIGADLANTVTKCAGTAMSAAQVGAAAYIVATERKNIWNYIRSKFKSYPQTNNNARSEEQDEQNEQLHENQG